MSNEKDVLLLAKSEVYLNFVYEYFWSKSAYRVPGPGSWVRDPGPGTRDPGPNKCPKG